MPTEAPTRADSARRKANSLAPHRITSFVASEHETTLKKLRRELALLRSYSLLDPPGRGLGRAQQAVPRL